MSPRYSTTMRRQAGGQRGFTLIELMVTVAIALFLLGGLLTILQNMRGTYANQQALAQLQDQQRFAMTVLTDVIQAGGYFPDPVGMTTSSALPADGAYQAGQAFTGTQGAGAPDSIGVRYVTAGSDGVILCDGSTNPGPAGIYAYTWIKPPGESDGVADPKAERFDQNCASEDAAAGTILSRPAMPCGPGAAARPSGLACGCSPRRRAPGL